MVSPLKQVQNLVAEGHSEEALHAVNEYLEDNANDYNALVLKGSALQRLGRFQEAENALGDAVKSDPHKLIAWKGLSKLHREQKDLMGSVKILPGFVAALVTAGKLDEARTVFGDLRRVIDGPKSAQTVKESFWSLQLPSSPLYGIIKMTPLEQLLPRFVAAREKELTKHLNTLKSRSKMNISFTPAKVASEKLRLIEESGLIELLDQQRQLDSENERRDAEARLLELSFEKMKLQPSIDSFEKLKELVDGMVLFETRTPLALMLHWDWQDISDYSELDTKQVEQFMQLFPRTHTSRVLDALLHSSLSPSPVTDEWAPQDIIETLSSSPVADEPNSILATRIKADLYVELSDWPLAVECAKSGISAVASQIFTLPNTLKSLNLLLGTAYTHFLAPRNFPLADAIYDQVLAQYPNEVAALVGKGVIHAQRTEWAEAISILKKVLVSHPTNLDALRQLAWAQIQMGNHDAGMAGLHNVLDLADALSSTPRTRYIRAETRFRIGYAHWQRQEWEESFNAFVSALQESPNFASAYTYLGLFYERRGDTARATKAWYKALNIDNGQNLAGERLARGFAEQGQWDLVRIVSQLVLGSDRVSSEIDAAAWPYRAMGIVSLNDRQYAQAAKYFQHCLRIEPEDTNSWIGLGEAYIESGRYKSAEKALKRALSLDPKSFSALHVLSRAQRAVLDFPGATDSIRAALEVSTVESPALVWALIDNAIRAAQYYRTQGLSGDAADETRVALETAIRELRIRPDHASVWDSIADVLRHCGRCFDDLVRELAELCNCDAEPITVAAEASLRALKLSKTKSERAMRHFNAAMSHATFNLKLAIDHAKQAVALRPRHPLYWRGYGILLSSLNPAVAQHCLVRSLILDGRVPETWVALGGLYLDQDDADLASEAFDRALAVDPDNSRAWLGLALVDRARGKSESHILRMLEHSYHLSDADDSIISRSYGFQAYRCRQQSATSIGALQRLLQLEPQSTEAAVILSLSLELRGDYVGALDNLPADEHVHSARLHLAVGDTSAAISEADVVLGIDPTNISALITSGLAHYFANDFDSSVDMFSSALQCLDDDRTSDQVLEVLVQVLHASGSAEAKQAAIDQLYDNISRNESSLTATLLLGVIGYIDGDTDVVNAVRDDIRDRLSTVPVTDIARVCRVLSVLEGSQNCYKRALFLYPCEYNLWKYLSPSQALIVADTQSLSPEQLSDALVRAGGQENIQRAIYYSPTSERPWAALNVAASI